MTFTNIVDTAMDLLNEITERRTTHAKKYPHGIVIENDTKYSKVENTLKVSKAEEKFSLMCNLLETDCKKIARVANKWYEKTEWKYNLSEKTAEKLFNLYKYNIS